MWHEDSGLAIQGWWMIDDPSTRRIDWRTTGILVTVVLVAVGAFLIYKRRQYVEDRREAQMQYAVTSLRCALRNYATKHGRHPHELTELVRAGELNGVPVDPVTGSPSTWRPTLEESVRVDDFQAAPGQPAAAEILDVHSGAAGLDSRGRRWSDY